MSPGIFKASPTLDLYCEWSSVCDSVTFVGTRAEMIAAGYDPERLTRAHLSGSSYLDGYMGGYDTEGLLILNGGITDGGWLPRKRLAAYLCALRSEDDWTAAYTLADRLLEPLDDDDDEPLTPVDGTPVACARCGVTTHVGVACEPHDDGCPRTGDCSCERLPTCATCCPDCRTTEVGA